MKLENFVGLHSPFLGRPVKPHTHLIRMDPVGMDDNRRFGGRDTGRHAQAFNLQEFEREMRCLAGGGRRAHGPREPCKSPSRLDRLFEPCEI